MSITIYDIGDVARITATFTDVAGVPADPSAVSLVYEDPSGAVTTHVFGTDAEVVKSSTGVYYEDVPIDEAGDWHYRWLATGTGAGAQQGQLMVKPTQAAI